MPRNWSKIVPEGNGPVPQQEEFGSDQPALADVYRLFKERFDRQLKDIQNHFDKMDELADEMRATKQRLAGLEQDVRQPRLAMEADVPSDTKAHERTEGAASTVQVKHWDSCSAKNVQADPTNSASFGYDFTGSPAVPCSRDDALGGNGAAAPKSCLSP